MTIRMDEGAAELLDTLHRAGYAAYVVGGCVRDSLLGLTPHDWDLCTSALPQQGMELFGAEKMVPVTSEYNHLVTSFGLKLLGPVYELMDQLLEAGAPSKQKFSVDPRPLDPNVPANFLQKVIFNHFMYGDFSNLMTVTH